MFKVTVLLTVVIAVSAEYFYRRDYTYEQHFDAFYKVHMVDNGSSYNDVFMTCYNEGSQLFYPKEKGEFIVVKNLMSSKLEGFENITDVIVGIHDEFGQGEFITADGQPTPSPLDDITGTLEGDCVIMNALSGELRTEACEIDPPTKRLFVCKKTDEKPCPTIDLGYKYRHDTRKCYKVNQRKTTWQDAWHTCYIEGGLLVSIESSEEASIVSRLLSDELYFSGFRRFPGRGSDYYTVKGKMLSDVGYFVHRNNWNDDFDQNCGVLYGTDTMYFSSSKCENLLPFVCEIQAKY